MKIILGIAGGLFFIFIIYAIQVSNSPEAEAKMKERLAIDWCWEQQGKKSNEPGTSRFIAGACEKMENDFTKKWGVKP